MKQLLFYAVLLIPPLLAIAQDKKIALLETLNGDKSIQVNGIEKNMVRGELRKAISNQGGYQAFTRTDIGQLMKEHGFQNSGIISDAQRKNLGETRDVQAYTVNGVSFTMISVEGGTFQMGSTTGDDDEKPVHQVTLSSFCIGQTEVTQELWQAVMGSNPSNFKGSKLPVENVSWDDCQTFITKLNLLTGKKFRLPTEAEWEYAARGGNKSKDYVYSGSNEIDDVTWFMSNSNSTTHDVATKSPNELGLYDMSGNVYEWCQDWYDSYGSRSQTNPTGPSSGSYRVLRGYSWHSNAASCRVTNRNFDTPLRTVSYLGLRLVQ